VASKHIIEYMESHRFDKEGRERPPEEVRKEAIQKLPKSPVLQSVEGTAAWWTLRLSELKAMVAKLGMPSAFLTLTEDEVSQCRFDEIVHLENMAEAVGRWERDPQRPVWTVSVCQCRASQ
jgi:hypothetical protein